jgi:exonuclease III
MFLHWNCNGLDRLKAESLQIFIKNHQPDIVSLNELKKSEAEVKELLKNLSEHFNITIRSRGVNQRGGGVALLVNKKHSTSPIELDSEFGNLEAIGITLHTERESVDFFSYYNPPHEEIDARFLTAIEKRPFVLAGDLNAIWTKTKSNRNGNILREFLFESEQSVVIENSEATYRKIAKLADNTLRDYRSTLDYFVASSILSTQQNGSIVMDDSVLISDHYPLRITVQLSHSISTQSQLPRRRNYRMAKWTEYRSLVDQALIGKTSQLKLLSCEQLNDQFCEILNDAAKVSIPVSLPHLRSPNSLPKAIREKINERHQMRRRIQEGADNLRPAYNKLTKHIKRVIEEYRGAPWRHLMQTESRGSLCKQMWRKIKSLQGSKQSQELPPLKMNGVTINTIKEKANLFAGILQETFADPTDQLFNQSHKRQVEKEVQDRTFRNDGSTEVEEATMAELNGLLSKLKIKSAAGPDEIHNSLLVNLPRSGREVLLMLVNKSLTESVLPGAWKESRITMIPKKSASTDPSGYRPISLTSCVGKLAERFVRNRLNNHVKANNIIVMEQSGFREGRSTTDNLLFMTQKGCEAMSTGRDCLAIFFDIAKAFDRVWHAGIIHKLTRINTPSYIVNWISNFLSNRVFRVQVGGETSEAAPITAGVPQGAILSPLLFSIYINDAPLLRVNDKTLSIFSLLYADDLVVLCIYKKGAKMKKLEEGLTKLEEWLSNWRLKVAVNKCSYTVFTRSLAIPNHNIRFYGERIVYERNPKFLGVIFDPTLTFNKQVEAVKQKVIPRLSILKILSNKQWGLSKRLLRSVYLALIRSIIDYNAFIVNTVSATQLKQLQIVQNKAIRILYKPVFKTELQPFAMAHKIPPVIERMQDLHDRYVQKCLSGPNPLILQLSKDYAIEFGGKCESKLSPLSSARLQIIFEDTEVTFLNNTTLLHSYLEELDQMDNKS